MAQSLTVLTSERNSKKLSSFSQKNWHHFRFVDARTEEEAKRWRDRDSAGWGA